METVTVLEVMVTEPEEMVTAGVPETVTEGVFPMETVPLLMTTPPGTATMLRGLVELVETAAGR